MDADEEEEEGTRYVYTYMRMAENMAIPPPSFLLIPDYFTKPDEVEVVDATETLWHDGHMMDCALFQNVADLRE
jgi:hypothetical protein